MNKTKLILLAVAAGTVAIGCHQGSILDSDLSQGKAYLDFSEEAIEVEAASFHADSTISTTFYVTSSRSWSLAVSEDAPWLDVSRTNGLNLGKISKEWPVCLTFQDNIGDEREVSLQVTIEGEYVELPVVQQKFEAVLGVESPASYVIPEQGDTLDILVRSNCNWTAQVSGTAKVTLDKQDGYKSESIQCVVKGNFDTSSGKEAAIVFSADGADDVIVNITQDTCVPRLEIDSELSETDVLPIAGDSQFVFETNESWTAALGEGAPSGVSLSAESGKVGEKLYIHFPDATFETVSATVTITTASGLTGSLTFTQRGCIFIPFRIWPDNNGATRSYQPWKLIDDGTKLPTRKTGDKGTGTWNVTDVNSREWVIWSGNTESVFYGEACGLTLGSISENPAFYIQFPAIEGKTLKEVKLMLGNSDVPLKDGSNCEPTAKGTTGWITDTENNVISGGESSQVRTYQKDTDWINTQTIPTFHSDYHNHTESMFHFVLTGTEPGTSYRFTGNYRMVIRWFILYYE